MANMQTPVTYSVQEAKEIRARFVRGERDLRCPRCRELLMYGPVIERGGHLNAEIFCELCQRVMMVRVADEIL